MRVSSRLLRPAVGVALLIAGTTACGGGETSSSLADRVLRADELPGFRPSSTRLADDAGSWAKIAPSALVDVAARLRREGFVAAEREDLETASRNGGALSIVVQVRSAQAAQAELARQLADYASEAQRLPGHTYTAFAATGIPGAHGFSSTDPSGRTGLNVIFSDGAFVYHVGAGGGSPPSRTAVVAASRKLYTRVHERTER